MPVEELYNDTKFKKLLRIKGADGKMIEEIIDERKERRNRLRREKNVRNRKKL